MPFWFSPKGGIAPGHSLGNKSGRRVHKADSGHKGRLCFMYLSGTARSAALGRNIHLLIAFHSFSEFNKLWLCSGDVHRGKKVTKVKVPAFMKFPFLWEEIDKKEGN